MWLPLLEFTNGADSISKVEGTYLNWEPVLEKNPGRRDQARLRTSSSLFYLLRRRRPVARQCTVGGQKFGVGPDMLKCIKAIYFSYFISDRMDKCFLHHGTSRCRKRLRQRFRLPAWGLVTASKPAKADIPSRQRGDDNIATTANPPLWSSAPFNPLIFELWLHITLS